MHFLNLGVKLTISLQSILIYFVLMMSLEIDTCNFWGRGWLGVEAVLLVPHDPNLDL